MGNEIIYAKDIKDVIKSNIFNHYTIYLKNGTSYYADLDDYTLLRLENILHKPYSKIVSDSVKKQISEDNKNKKNIVIGYITISLYDQCEIDKQTKLSRNIRNLYIKDIIAYHKLLVHRGNFEALITKVLENKEEIYTSEFQDKFNTERDKFLEILRKKSNNFTSKL